MEPIYKSSQETRNDARLPETEAATIAIPLIDHAAPAQVPSDTYVTCPSFEDEPWKSRAAALRPKTLEAYAVNLASDVPLPEPLPASHAYVRLLLEFLDTVPPECWIDEENEID